MSAAGQPLPNVWTEAALQALPKDGDDHELVHGRLVMSPKNNFQHENVFSRLYLALAEFNRRERLGVVRGSSAGFWMHNRNCRAPDISFIPRARFAALGFKPNARRFFPGAPDLAVEILSPSNTQADVQARLADFFASGTQLAWVIDPERQLVEIFRSPSERQVADATGFLDGAELLSRFCYPVAQLFKEWDWE